MQQKLEKKEDYDYCPNCGMPQEDSESCNYCDWESVTDNLVEGKKNEKSFD